jgi:hypothetical protein
MFRQARGVALARGGFHAIKGRNLGGAPRISGLPYPRCSTVHPVRVTVQNVTVAGLIWNTPEQHVKFLLDRVLQRPDEYPKPIVVDRYPGHRAFLTRGLNAPRAAYVITL